MSENNVFSSMMGIIIAVTAVLVLIILIFPIHALLLDILLVSNLLFVLLIFITAIRTKKATDFLSCPTMFLLSIIFGLAVNISATRLILTKGTSFDGRLISFLSSLLTKLDSRNLIIILAVFVILMIVQIIIVARGTVRISEVAARFTMDSLPGKQMAIDTEYSSGVITEKESITKKNKIHKEVDFYGAMNGACKFLSGNEKVKLVILLASTIGGFFIGTRLRDETINDALKTYISLSISTGFFFMIQTLLLSFAVWFTIGRTPKDSP